MDIVLFKASIAARKEGYGLKKHFGKGNAGSFCLKEVTEGIVADTCGGPRHACEISTQCDLDRRSTASYLIVLFW